MPAKWGEIRAEEMVIPLRGKIISGPPKLCFHGLGTDSRNIGPGQLFWALKGARYDGHHFIQDAINKGAAGIVYNQDYQLEN